ncbi:MAG TPA: MFS transporter, partial [Anaerolineae bacterium]
VFVVYGAWLEDRFGLSVTSLGLASIVIALAEFTAESGAAGLVDRIGKRRAVAGGILLSAAAYLLLPHAAGGLAGALAGMCLVFLAFEFAIVATLPLVSELAPGARATVLALNVAAMSFGRVVASVSGPRLWLAGGLLLNTGVSAVLALAAALILIFAVKESPVAH